MSVPAATVPNSDSSPSPTRPFPIIDVHAHFPIENTLPSPSFTDTIHPLLSAYAADRMVRMNHEWSTQPNEPPAKTPEQVEVNADRWLAELDRHAIAKINFVSAHSNDQLAAIVKRHPERFMGFAHHPLLPGAGKFVGPGFNQLNPFGFLS